MKAAHIIGSFPIISEQISLPALQVVLSNLEAVLSTGIQGEVVEFGCYTGTTSLFIRRLLDCYEPADGRKFHVYDSFAGLPAKGTQDLSPVGDDFKPGELSVSKKQLLREFHKARLHPPVIHKAWFSDLTTTDVPEKIAFAFLDADFYSSITDSLRQIWPHMVAGGVICVDDCQRDALPGVDRAVRDFFQFNPRIIRVAHHIGIIKA